MNHQNNIYRIKTVHQALGELQSSAVFVGGATVSLYADQQTFEVRETDDVDVIIEILNYAAHANLEEQLREKGFANDMLSTVRCRYKINGITVDIMPTKDVAMGFENIWYPDGYRNAMDFQLDETTAIKILTPPYFVATKIEAFKNRGARDPRQSQDFEDIVYVLENRRSIWSEVRECPEPLRNYLTTEFKQLLANESIYEWIDSHVEFGSPPSTDWILDEMNSFVNENS
jgi:hypothetical protein